MNLKEESPQMSNNINQNLLVFNAFILFNMTLIPCLTTREKRTKLKLNKR